MSTKIPYCDATLLNPWVGCTKVRAGCQNCYAERLAYRLAAMGQENYKAVLSMGCWNGQVRYQLDQMEKPLHWKKGRRIFVGSMSDVFYEKVSDLSRDELWAMMARCPQHIFQIPTKRIKLAAKYLSSRCVLPNIHLLISCSTQKDLDEMAPVLLQIPAAVRGVSFEPLIERISLLRAEDYCELHLGRKLKDILHWAVIGCESGSHRRPCNIEWVRSIVRQCKEAGVAVYVKQLDINGKVVSDPKDFPEDMRIRSYPK